MISRRILPVQAVIFDMDGVITNTMPDHFRAWKKIFLAQGIRVSHLDIYRREGQKGITSVKEIFRERKLSVSEAQARRILQEKEKLFNRIVKRRFIPGARNFLRFLHKNGTALGLVTGTSRPELERILPISLRSLFSVIVTGSDVKHGKPHPEPYLQAVAALRINRDDLVVIENAPFGIQSAQRAGLKCFALETSLPRKYLKEADGIFSSVKELKNHLFPAR